jgi:hypothetical protein
MELDLVSVGKGGVRSCICKDGVVTTKTSSLVGTARVRAVNPV